MSDTPVAGCLSPPEILARPDLSIERRVMAMAFIFPEADRGRRSKHSTLWKARYILRHSPALAEDVLAERMKLDEALQIVEKAKPQDSNSIDDDDDANVADRRHYPDAQQACPPAAMRRPTPHEISAMTDALDRFLNDERIVEGEEHQSPHYEFLSPHTSSATCRTASPGSRSIPSLCGRCFPVSVVHALNQLESGSSKATSTSGSVVSDGSVPVLGVTVKVIWALPFDVVALVSGKTHGPEN